jgi:hypothetical protein
MDRLLTELETSRRVNRAVSTLQKDRCVGGGIPFVKIGRQVRYRESVVERYIESLPSYRSTSEIDVAHGLDRLASISAAPPLNPAVNDAVSVKDPAPRIQRRRTAKTRATRLGRPQRKTPDRVADQPVAEATPT